MANHCFNTINFYGKNTLKVAKFWEDELITYYEKMDYLSELSIYTPEERKTHDSYTLVGTKWIDTDYSVLVATDHFHLSCSSAWSPPRQLVQRICKLFKVSAHLEFEEGGSNFAGFEYFDTNGDMTESFNGTVVEYLFYKNDSDEIYQHVDGNVEGWEQETLDLFSDFLSDEDMEEFNERLGKDL